MIIAISDTHLGTDHLGPTFNNREDVKAFLRFLRDNHQPDHLVLNGDIEDLWRRDMRTLTRENFDIFHLLQELQDGGTAVHYVLGNHDWYARKDVRRGRVSYYVNDYAESLTLTDAGTSYTFMHGHQFDPLQDEWYFDKLALVSDDAFGSKFSHLWEIYSETRDLADAAATTKRLVIDRLTRGRWQQRIERMDRCQTGCDATAELHAAHNYAETMLDTDVICTGHTHIPSISTDGRTANSGAWVGNRTTYLEINDGIRLLDWNDGNPQELPDRIEE